jgi:putative secretion ATPase (PEP-CTERM system associated)
MYKEFFQFKSKPFDLTPNPDFLYLSNGHKKALTYLEYGIRSNLGFILLTGDVGCGKTTIIRNLIGRLPKRFAISKVFNTSVDSDQLIRAINDDFGLDVSGKSKFDLLKDLNDFLISQFAKDIQCVLIIDESQNLSRQILEEIRLLSNLETNSTKLLQIIMVGQPELQKKLFAPDLCQLRQRISLRCHINPLTREDLENYVLHRLDTAGNKNALSFSPEAFDSIYSKTKGVPRLTNILCEYILLDAFASNSTDINEETVNSLADDIEFERVYWNTDEKYLEENGRGDRNSADSKYNRSVAIKALQDIQKNLVKLEGSRLKEVLGDLELIKRSLEELKSDNKKKFAEMETAINDLLSKKD